LCVTVIYSQPTYFLPHDFIQDDPGEPELEKKHLVDWSR